MKQNLRHFLALVVSLAGALPAIAATPTVGQPAPPLTFTQLLNAPVGTKTDWPSLKGKVVVLEFWATWCAPCISEIPHLNDLARSLSANNVQFIAVDDEDPAVVKEFIEKKPMAGWVGVSKQAINDYGVESRPATAVIDTHGNLAAMIQPDSLTKESLIALSEGKPVEFPTEKDQAENAAQRKAIVDAMASMNQPAEAGAPAALFEISIRPGKADGMTMMFMGNKVEADWKNAPLSILLPWATRTRKSRVMIHGDSGKARFDVHLDVGGLTLEQLAPSLELALTTAAGVKLTRVSEEEDVYLVEATSKSNELLTPTASKLESLCFYDNDKRKVLMVKASLNNLANSLEDGLGRAVVNESGIAGEFDGEVQFEKGNLEQAKASLESHLGITLVKGKRPISRILVDPVPPEPQPAGASPAAK